jgi:hypothetical protein
MPVWTVEIAGGENERVEAEMLVLESGGLIALSGECLIVRAWAPGQWRTVQHITGAEQHREGNRSETTNVVVELTSV